jgi:adenosylcobyric acid synthase
MSARAVMVLGCTSGAGKSWLTTALCRWYARQGLKVAPFKAQNMSNHARVVPMAGGGWGEIGTAQYLQALAAHAQPDVRMNPVLLKPEADTRSQVVLMGQVRHDLTTMPWRERSALLWPTAQQALTSLQSDHDVLVIEGAGSPAEINLAAQDFVNTSTALASQAACLLVSDIDRGGAFAHLYGTHALMDAQVRQLVRGFVLNRFRGDATLLAPGPQMLQDATGVPTLAVIPMVRDHGLPEEDALPADSASTVGPRVVVLVGPCASNLDEFEPLRHAGVMLHFAHDAHAVHGADWVVLPGSKNTQADLTWWRSQGLGEALQRHVNAGRPLLGICGGLQMLGQVLSDAQGLEGLASGGASGLGLLPLHTDWQSAKQLAQRGYKLGALSGPWAPLAGLSVNAYEIHLGRSKVLGCAGGLTEAVAGSPQLGWQQGPVLALYLHGLFENPEVLQALWGRRAPPLEQVFDRLADQLDACFAPGVLMGLLSPR